VDAVQAFAEEAVSFEQWARLGTSSGAVGARQCLVRLVQLYGAALALPSEWSDGLDASVAERVADQDTKAVASYFSARLPLDNYGEVFDPLGVPVEEPVIGSLVDDCCDIYRDVVTGLRLYTAGRHEEAVWQWAFNFRSHWGEHATGAIRALHAWLAADGPDAFSAEREAPRDDQASTAELSNRVEAALLDRDGSARDLNFDNPTWRGVWALLVVLRSNLGSVCVGSESREAAEADSSEVDEAVRCVQLSGGYVQLLVGDGRDLLKRLQVFLSPGDSPSPIVEVTFFPDDWATRPPLAKRFIVWVLNLRRVLEADRVYVRYENASWVQGDIGPTSGVFFASSA
jgi:hypothetical protein